MTDVSAVQRITTTATARRLVLPPLALRRRRKQLQQALPLLLLALILGLELLLSAICAFFSALSAPPVAIAAVRW